MDLFDPKALETDPNGLAAHEPGAKLDLGKPMVDLTLDGFSRALLAVAQVSTYGAKKYSPNGWKAVPNGEQRYRSAGDRHRLFRGHEVLDHESKLTHLAHEAWNRLAELELYLQSRDAHSEDAAAVAVRAQTAQMFAATQAAIRAAKQTSEQKTEPAAGRQPGAPDAAPEQAASEKSVPREKPAAGTDLVDAIHNFNAAIKGTSPTSERIEVRLFERDWDTMYRALRPSWRHSAADGEAFVFDGVIFSRVTRV